MSTPLTDNQPGRQKTPRTGPRNTGPRNTGPPVQSAFKALFIDTETEEIVYADGLKLVSDKTPLTGRLLEDLDQDETDSAAFTGYQNLVPALGYNKFDGHVYVSGATGAGKSFLINEMLKHDRRQRLVFLFTDHKKVDPSLKPMIQSGRMLIVRREPDEQKPWEVSTGQFARDKKGSIIMFDDCTDPDAIFMRDNALRKARHEDTVVVCVNHKLRDSKATKHMLTNARFLIAFPSSNRGAVGAFMKDWMEMPPKSRRSILRLSIADGRQIVFHMQSPNVVATARSVVQI